jgi:hypothetical protein
MRGGSFKLVSLFLILAAVGEACVSQSQTPDVPEANPGRPTVSTPATLTPTGYLQFETGILSARHSMEFSSRYGFNEVMKLSVIPRIQFLAASEPVVHSTTAGIAANAAGDVFLGAQAVLVTGEGSKPTLSASYFRHIYGGGAPDFDVGTPTNSFLLLGSADVRGFHYDANAFFNELTQAPVRRAQFGQSLSISHPIAGKFSISGEIWYFTQPFLHGQAIGNLWAVGYTARKNLVLDAGFNRGLTDTSTRWEAFVGFTYLLPHRLW